MSEGIVPLRRRGDAQSALARVDVAAVEMLACGRAASLQAARAEVILTNLREQRDQMTILLADLRGRTPTGDVQIDAVNANLIAALNQGLVQIDLLIAQAQVLVSESSQPGVEQSGAPSTP